MDDDVEPLNALPADFRDFKESVWSDSRSDGVGVYEVWWEANTRYPSYPVSVRLAIAERAVADLLAERRIRLYRGGWAGDERVEVPEGDAAHVLREWATWVPQDDAVIWLGTVEAADD